MIVANGQSCSPSYVDFQGNCILNCTSLTGAANPATAGSSCICQSATPYINTTTNSCVASCASVNAYTHTNPLTLQCISNCPTTITGSLNPTSYGNPCICTNYLSSDGTQCISTCGTYLSLNQKICLTSCNVISGAVNPPSTGLTCMCSNGSSYFGPGGMSCVSSCSSSYIHIDPQTKQCISNCPSIITNSSNPAGYGAKCICSGATPYLSLDRTTCIASCPTNSAANTYGICICNSSYPVISSTGTSCVATCVTSYINLNPTYPQCVSSCTNNWHVSNPTSYNLRCVCTSGYPYLNFDSANNFFCNTACFYYQEQDPSNYSCLKDCTTLTNMVNPTSLGSTCQCASSYPYLQSTLQSCGSGCGSTYKDLNPSVLQCFSNCPASFSNSINSTANTPCSCPSNYPYVLADYSACSATCMYYNTNPYITLCISNCLTQISGSINPASVLDQGRCNCSKTSNPYLSLNNQSCVANCNTSYIAIWADICDSNCNTYFSANTPNFQGLRCYCGSSQKYLAENGKSCVSSCTQYYHPNSQNLICIQSCPALGMTNPATIGLACTCSGATPYLSVKKDVCIAACPTNATSSGIQCSCGTYYLTSDSTTCSSSCSDYYHVDLFNHQCVANCPNTILGSSNPSSAGQYCQCPSNRPYIRIDMQGGYYCDSGCPNYFIGNFCVDSCTAYTNMSNPSSTGNSCVCSNSNYYIDPDNRQCVATCPHYVHVVKKQCLTSCSQLVGAQTPSSGNACICSPSTPMYDYASDSCTNTCNHYLHPNPTVYICFSDCPSQIPNSSNPTNGTSYCQCSNTSYQYLGIDSFTGGISCVSSCANYLFFNVCVSSCTVFPSSINPSGTSTNCICNSPNTYYDSVNYKCTSSCPNYISLLSGSTVCVNNCSAYSNAVTPPSTNQRCLCNQPNYPYIQSNGLSCVSSCLDYLSLDSSSNQCVSDCPTSFPGSVNPLFNGYQCKCAVSTPYKNLNSSSCSASCPSNQTSVNGVCQCSSSLPYISEDGITCLSSCPNYINPNLSSYQCVATCSQFTNFQTPTSLNSRCVCNASNQYIQYDYSSCQPGCQYQSFLHFSTAFFLCIKDCPSSISGAVNPTNYGSKCLCGSSLPYISLDMTKCVSSCSGSYISINSQQCVANCASITGATTSGANCVCSTGYYLNIDSQSCVTSCPQYSTGQSGKCVCTNGLSSGGSYCNVSSTTNTDTTVVSKGSTFSQHIIWNFILLYMYILF